MGLTFLQVYLLIWNRMLLMKFVVVFIGIFFIPILLLQALRMPPTILLVGFYSVGLDVVPLANERIRKLAEQANKVCEIL